jgi:hypothetical protein
VAQGDKAGTIAHDDAVGVISQLHGDDGSLNVAAVPQVIGRMKALSAGDVEKRAQARKADVEAANAGGKPQNLINVPPDTTVFDPVTRQPVYTAPPKITEPKPPTSEEDKAKAVTIRAKLLAKAPVSQEDRLWLQAHEAEATLTTDKSASFAAGRAATAAEGTNSRLDRTQAFQEAQAGRKELTDKVEQPYLDAKEKAATLRSVIEAAKGGNMAAGNVQSLLATLGLVTMEGVKRINTTELESVQGAGSLLERIKGEIGGITAGKPLSPKIQQDLTQMATLLEQSARKKYEQGFKQITGRYGLKDEQILPSEVPTSAAPAGGVPTYQDYLKAKQGKP